MVYPDFTKGSKEVDLGDAASFTELPATVVIDDYEFFLAQSKEGNYKLLSSLCPHSWGTIFHEDNCFMCPTHGWRFEVSEGICVNGPNLKKCGAPLVEPVETPPAEGFDKLDQLMAVLLSLNRPPTASSPKSPCLRVSVAKKGGFDKLNQQTSPVTSCGHSPTRTKVPPNLSRLALSGILAGI